MDAKTIIFIHEYLTEFFHDKEDPISPPGVKNEETVESAAARPFSTAGGHDAYPTTFLKAAALFHSIACNHSFHNGNKRTALLSTVYFLSEYNLWLDKCDDEEMYEFTRKIAAHEICENRVDEVSVIADWLELYSRRNTKGEKPMKFGELRDTLMRFDFTLVENENLFDIYKDDQFQTSIRRKGLKGFEDYDPDYISNLRKKLNLTSDYGIDSARFYGQKGITEDLTEFMKLRLEVMKKLAKI